MASYILRDVTRSASRPAHASPATLTDRLLRRRARPVNLGLARTRHRTSTRRYYLGLTLVRSVPPSQGSLPPAVVALPAHPPARTHPRTHARTPQTLTALLLNQTAVLLFCCSAVLLSACLHACLLPVVPATLRRSCQRCRACM